MAQQEAPGPTGEAPHGAEDGREHPRPMWTTMTPDAFAARHPRLYHLTASGAAAGIRARGLLTAAQAVARLAPGRTDLLDRRPAHAALPGGVVLGDNGPLNLGKLAACLDDGLTPARWLAMLNDRAFFYVSLRHAGGFVASRRRKGQATEILTFDALGLIRAHLLRVEIAPINTGATVHDPARRGLSTFAPLDGLDWDAWRRARGRRAPDRVKEVAVRGGVPDAGDHLIDVAPA